MSMQFSDDEEDIETTRAILLEYAAAERPPLALRVTLFLGGTLLQGRRATLADFAGDAKRAIISVAEGETKLPDDHNRLVALTKKTDVSAITDEQGSDKFIYFACERLTTSAGVILEMSDVLFRLRLDSIDGFAFGSLDMPPNSNST